MANEMRRLGFTLIEVLIVAVMLAVLAAVVVPQFLNSNEDAKVTSAKFSLQTLRSQIQLYKSEHGSWPGDDLQELLMTTSGDGTTDSSDGPLTSGPYLESIPVNPFTGSATVVEIENDPATAADITATDGWLYNKQVGQIWLNHADYISD